jgi:hypothetical protein
VIRCKELYRSTPAVMPLVPPRAMDAQVEHVAVSGSARRQLGVYPSGQALHNVAVYEKHQAALATAVILAIFSLAARRVHPETLIARNGHAEAAAVVT